MLFKEAVWLLALSQQGFLSVPQVLPTNSDRQTGRPPGPRPQALPASVAAKHGLILGLSAVEVGRREPVLSGA